MSTFAVCAAKPWNVEAFSRRTTALPGRWTLIETPNALTMTRLTEIAPRYVFFPHWSWRVPAEIIDSFECVCFHMTDVPYGRGGSPLQNLIVRGHRSTKLSALRMTAELDAGPVYFKRSLSLEGRAEDIFRRAADLTYDMMSEIVMHEPRPMAQAGDIVSFPRRTPEQSALPEDGTVASLYDFIRMLDAPTYPAACVEWGDWRIEFDHASLDGDCVRANAIIRRRIPS